MSCTRSPGNIFCQSNGSYAISIWFCNSNQSFQSCRFFSTRECSPYFFCQWFIYFCHFSFVLHLCRRYFFVIHKQLNDVWYYFIMWFPYFLFPTCTATTVQALMEERDWSDYRLSQESGLSASTIANIHHRNTVPSITTLQSICDALGISLSQFFAEAQEEYFVHLTQAQKEMFDDWLSLTGPQKTVIAEIIKEFKKK